MNAISTDIPSKTDAEVIAACEQAWDWYMYEEAADSGYNAAESQRHANAYSEANAECKRRGLEPFKGRNPNNAMPLEWAKYYRSNGGAA